jgi:hypothetical protein
MQKSKKNTARKSLPSASQLPIIVPMKIWSRTGTVQGGEQSARQHSSANPTSPKSTWPPRRPVLSDTSPAKNPANHSLRRGTACCARCRAADQRRSLAHGGSMPSTTEVRVINLPTVYQAGSSHSPLVIRHCSHFSTRFCPKSRNYTKQIIKPCIPGARIAHRGFRSAGDRLVNPIGIHPKSICDGLALLGLELDSLSAQATRASAPSCPVDGTITVISNRELLVLETPQVAENKHRRPVLIENFEPNSAPSFRPLATAAFSPREVKGSRAAFPLIDGPRNRFNADGAV